MFLLAIWLIVTGLLPLLRVAAPLSGAIGTILNLLAVVAGVLILPVSGKLTEHLGMLLLGIWLILTGLLPLLNVHIPASGTGLALLAILTGVLILREQ